MLCPNLSSLINYFFAIIQHALVTTMLIFSLKIIFAAKLIQSVFNKLVVLTCDNTSGHCSTNTSLLERQVLNHSAEIHDSLSF